MRKLASILLTIVMLFTLCAPAAAVTTSGAATTLRLERAEGTVTTKNAAGTAITVRDGMRLANGYEISTGLASYAYISLDSTKAIKLDASSTGSVRQTGTQLEVQLTAGSLFFDVSVPLKASENLTIRTSTMVTGVRGTAGWVEIIDAYTTRITLLEGKLEVTTTDPVTGDQRTTVLEGGQTLTAVYEGEGQGLSPDLIGDHETIQDLVEEDVIHEEQIIYTDTGLTVEELQEDDVPGFAAEEVAKSPDLQERIEDSTELDVEEIVGLEPGATEGMDEAERQEAMQEAAEEKVAEDESAAEEENERVQEAVEQLGAEETDPLFEEEEEEEEDYTSGGGGGSSTPSTPPAEEPEEEETPVTYYTLTVIHQDEDGNVLMGVPSVGVASGATYSAEEEAIDGYVLLETRGDPVSGTMDGDKTVIFVYTPVTRYYTLTVKYEMTDGTEIQESTSETLAEGADYEVEEAEIDGYNFLESQGDAMTGTMDGDKTVTLVYAKMSSTTLVDPTTDKLTSALNFGYDRIHIQDANATGGNLDLAEAINNSDAGTVENELFLYSGSAEITDAVTVNGELRIYDGVTLTNSGTLVGNGTVTAMGGTLTNNGVIDINNTESLDITDGATLTNQGSITIGVDTAGAMTVDESSSFTNIGNLTVSEDSYLTVDGELTNEANGTKSFFYIYGTASFGGTVNNAGVITVQETGSLTLSGTMDNLAVGTATSASLKINGSFHVEDGAALYNNVGSSISSVSNSGTFICDGSFTNYGDFFSDGTFSGEGSITNEIDTSCIFTVSAGTFEIQDFDNFCGTVTVGTDATMLVHGIFNNGSPYALLDPCILQINGSMTVDGELTVSSSDHQIFVGSSSAEGSLQLGENSTFTPGPMTVSAGSTLRNYGDMTTANPITVDGEFENLGSFFNSGELVINGEFTSDGTFHNTFSVEVNGTCTLDGETTNEDLFHVAPTGSVELYGIMHADEPLFSNPDQVTVCGSFTSYAGSELYNAAAFRVFTENLDGTCYLELNGYTENTGMFNIEDGEIVILGEVSNEGLLTTRANANGAPNISVEATGEVQNYSNLEIGGGLLNKGLIENYEEATFTVAGITENFGEIANEDPDFSPAGIYLRNMDGEGIYTDTADRPLTLMVEDPNGIVVAWGVIPQAVIVTPDPASPFYYEDEIFGAVEDWRENHIYTVYGEQTDESETGDGSDLTPVFFPIVTVPYVTLDLNGRTVDLRGSSIGVHPSMDGSTVGDLSVKNGTLVSSEASTLFDMQAGSLALGNVDAVNTALPQDSDVSVISASSIGNDAYPLSIYIIDCLLECEEGIAIYVDAMEDNYIAISGSTVTAGYGIYFNGYASELEMADSEITATMGSAIEARGLTVAIDGSTVTGANHAIDCFDFYNYDGDPDAGGITITDSTITAENDSSNDYQFGIWYSYYGTTAPNPIVIDGLSYDRDSGLLYSYEDPNDGETYYMYTSENPENLPDPNDAIPETSITSGTTTVFGDYALYIHRAED